jgi:hypothetical protein
VSPFGRFLQSTLSWDLGTSLKGGERPLVSQTEAIAAPSAVETTDFQLGSPPRRESEG